MKLFLKLKHWQIFLLIIGIPFPLAIITVVCAVLNVSLVAPLVLLGISYFVAIGTQIGWFYAVGTNLNTRLPGNVTMNLSLFRVCTIFPWVYFIAFVFFAFRLFPLQPEQLRDTPPYYLVLVFPLHFFAMFCMIYDLYFVAKSLKAVELQRRVTFSDYAGEFFLFWFYPVGVWILQPRINQLFNGQYPELDSFLKTPEEE